MNYSGAHVRIACDGERAIEVLEEEDFDLLLLDVELPGLSGLEVAAQARVLRPYIAISMMTNEGDDPKAVKYEEGLFNTTVGFKFSAIMVFGMLAAIYALLW